MHKNNNNLIKTYFTNSPQICHKILIKTYFIGVFLNVIFPKVATSFFIYGFRKNVYLRINLKKVK